MLRQQFADLTITDAARRLLTMREEQCLDMFLDGRMTQAEIGRQLGISRPVVHRHLRGAKKKIKGGGVQVVSMSPERMEELGDADLIAATL